MSKVSPGQQKGSFQWSHMCMSVRSPRLADLNSSCISPLPPGAARFAGRRSPSTGLSATDSDSLAGPPSGAGASGAGSSVGRSGDLDGWACLPAGVWTGAGQWPPPDAEESDGGVGGDVATGAAAGEGGLLGGVGCAAAQQEAADGERAYAAAAVAAEESTAVEAAAAAAAAAAVAAAAAAAGKAQVEEAEMESGRMLRRQQRSRGKRKRQRRKRGKRKRQRGRRGKRKRQRRKRCKRKRQRRRPGKRKHGSVRGAGILRRECQRWSMHITFCRSHDILHIFF